MDKTNIAEIQNKIEGLWSDYYQNNSDKTPDEIRQIVNDLFSSLTPQLVVTEEQIKQHCIDFLNDLRDGTDVLQDDDRDSAFFYDKFIEHYEENFGKPYSPSSKQSEQVEETDTVNSLSSLSNKQEPKVKDGFEKELEKAMDEIRRHPKEKTNIHEEGYLLGLEIALREYRSFTQPEPSNTVSVDWSHAKPMECAELSALHKAMGKQRESKESKALVSDEKIQNILTDYSRGQIANKIIIERIHALFSLPLPEKKK